MPTRILTTLPNDVSLTGKVLTPFNVSEPFVCPMLNADLWDGYHITDRLPSLITDGSITLAGNLIGGGRVLIGGISDDGSSPFQAKLVSTAAYAMNINGDLAPITTSMNYFGASNTRTISTSGDFGILPNNVHTLFTNSLTSATNFTGVGLFLIGTKTGMSNTLNINDTNAATGAYYSYNSIAMNNSITRGGNGIKYRVVLGSTPTETIIGLSNNIGNNTAYNPAGGTANAILTLSVYGLKNTISGAMNQSGHGGTTLNCTQYGVWNSIATSTSAWSTTSQYIGIGFYLDAMSGPSNATLPNIFWGFYNNTSANNAFGSGNSSFGITASTTTSPTAKIQIGAGTASAGTAPLKFNTTGILNTIPEEGAFEASTNWLYYTGPSLTRQYVVMTAVNALLQNTRIPFSNSSGFLTDDADLTFITDTLFVPNVGTSTIKTDTTTPTDLTITTGSQKTIVLNTVVWDDALPYSVNPGTGLTAMSSEDYGTTGFKWYYFDNNVAANEEIQVFFQFPHSIKTDSNISLHLHTVASANGSAGNEDVEFSIEYQWVTIGGSYSTTTNTVVKDATTVFRVGASDANKHLIWDFSEFVGTSKGISSDLMVRVKRVTKTADRTADNYTGKVYLRFVDAHFQKDTIGSRQETVK